jgi:hypothetical protein
VCRNQQTTCPAAYPSCPSNATTQPPAIQKVCTPQDLVEAAAACAGGAASAGCQAFFSTETQINAACAACLSPFDVPFNQETGLFLCVAPFVGASCNTDTGCYVDCITKSCAQCPAGQVNQCRNQARNGDCQQYFSGTTCTGGAFFGAGAFCNPANYQGFGNWLRGVGGHYCGQ